MHNCFIMILTWICSLQLFLFTSNKVKISSTTLLIDTALLEDCLDLDSLLESSNSGFSAIQLDKEKVKIYVQKTLENSFPEFTFKIYYYFYDSKTLKNCSISGIPCNSVQMKIIIQYQQIKMEKILRYELKERK